MQGGGLGRLNLGSEGERSKNRRRSLWEMSGTIKVLEIILSRSGVDGRGSLPPWQSSLVLDACRA